ncbi:MAG: bifunctional heptose 7-phosphate kinase/heptose 1-phosphate adenyltransferase, partial [Promethearchaeota archaeon]
MTLADEIDKWKNKKILIIGPALVDMYIYGRADHISPDAPVPSVKIEKRGAFLGGIGRVLKYVKSLGGIPEVCTIIGKDYEGDFFLNKMSALKVDISGILVDDQIKTPQITKIKARNQHLLRLETDYSTDIRDSTIKNFLKIIETRSKDVNSIVILDYGVGGLFEDLFIQELLTRLKTHYKNIPIIVRPNSINYYLYEEVDLIKINLQKALEIFSIERTTETSVIIAAKKIINTSRAKNVLLNYLENDSILLSQDSEKVQKFSPILQDRIRSYVAVGSVIMAVLGLSLASGNSMEDTIKLALYSGALT